MIIFPVCWHMTCFLSEFAVVTVCFFLFRCVLPTILSVGTNLSAKLAPGNKGQSPHSFKKCNLTATLMVDFTCCNCSCDELTATLDFTPPKVKEEATSKALTDLKVHSPPLHNYSKVSSVKRECWQAQPALELARAANTFY